MFGIYKTDSSYTAEFFQPDTESNDSERSDNGLAFFGIIFWDVVLVLALSFHRHNLVCRGLWWDPPTDSESEQFPSTLTGTGSSTGVSITPNDPRKSLFHIPTSPLTGSSVWEEVENRRRERRRERKKAARNPVVAFFVRNSLLPRPSDGRYHNEVEQRVGRDFYYATIWTQMVLLLYAVFVSTHSLI